MKIWLIRYFDKFGLRREKDINAENCEAAITRFNSLIKDAEIYEIVGESLNAS